MSTNQSPKDRKRGESQPMVIMENTPPETICADQQLSDWDRMISQ